MQLAACNSDGRQAQAAGRFPPCRPASRAKLHPITSCVLLLHLGHRQTAGASALWARAEPAQAASCSGIHSIPSLDCTHELLTPHCCSSCSSVSPAATMPCSHLRGSRQLPPTRSFSCPDAPGDLSQVPPLGWKNPRPGSCKASSKPHTADQVGTSFPWLQQEQGARGFAAKPGLSASWCPQG